MTNSPAVAISESQPEQPEAPAKPVFNRSKMHRLTKEVVSARIDIGALKEKEAEATAELKLYLQTMPDREDSWDDVHAFLAGGNPSKEPYKLDTKSFMEAVARGVPEVVAMFELYKIPTEDTAIQVRADYTKAEKARQKAKAK